MPDAKVSALTELTTTAVGDLIPIIDDPAGTPISKRIKVENLFKPPAGTTTIPPLQLTAGTTMTTPAPGAIEMDANNIYATTDAGNRGIVPIRHIIRADTTRTFTSNTSQQAIFSTPAGGTLTLETGSYIFKAFILVTGTSATSGNIKFSLIGAGGATLGSILWHAVGADAASDALVAMNGLIEVIATQTAANLHTATTATQTLTNIDGTFEVTGAGTIIPSIAQTTAAAAVVAVGSYFYCERIGSTSMTSVGQWT